MSDLRIPQVIEVDHLIDELETLYRTGGPPRGKSTGWPMLDNWYTVRKREWTLVTGYPNHGKSVWLDNLLINLAYREDWNFGIFSAENLPIPRHIASLIELYTGKPFREGPTVRLTPDEVRIARNWVQNHFVFINPALDDRKLSHILDTAEWLVNQYQVDGLVIDPWNELDHSRPHGMREDEWISISLSQIRYFARNRDVHFFVVAHPNMPKRGKDDKFPVPTMYDVKGASEWNAKADNGICVWRDLLHPEEGTDVHVQKVRFREVGKAGGGCKLWYDVVSGRFNESRW